MGSLLSFSYILYGAVAENRTLIVGIESQQINLYLTTAYGMFRLV